LNDYDEKAVSLEAKLTAFVYSCVKLKGEELIDPLLL